MERGTEISLPSHPPPAMGRGRWSDGASAMLPHPHHPAMGRGRGLGRTVGHNMALVPRRYPTMAPRGRDQGSKSRLGPYRPPMGQDSSPGARIGAPGSDCRSIDAGRMLPSDAAMPMFPLIPVLSVGIVKSIAADLGNYGLILLLFEMPSGFALFSFNGIYLCEPHAMENLWANLAGYSKARQIALLRDFETFDDKFRAINFSTGVSERLKNMILKHRRSGQKLAVGKHEYKIIIENTMGIPCLCGENVMEAMWGLQNLMHRFLPEEKTLTKQDRLPMSHGLKKALSRYGFDDVEPEMVNEQMMMTACALFECDYTVKKYAASLFTLSRRIKDVSDIDTDDWNYLKLATALKVIFCPEEVGDYHEMFSEDERTKLVDDAHKHAREMIRSPALQASKEMVSAYKVRNEKKILLRNLVTEAKERMKLKIAEDS